MKKFIVFLAIIIFALQMSSCSNTDFTFRGSHFGDSIEQVQLNESDESEINEGENYKYINYDNVKNYDDYTSSGSYYFVDNRLIVIYELINYNENESDVDKDEVFEKIKKELKKYGSPSEEEKGERADTALWEADDFGIVLWVADGYVTIIYSAYPGRASKSYDDPQNSFSNMLFE